MAKSRTTFQPGQKPPKGAGRPKGSPNRRTMALANQLEELKVDPVGTMATILAEQMRIFEERKERGNTAGQLVALSDAEKTTSNMLQYLFPKKKAIEHSGEVNLFSFADFMALAKSGKPK